MVERWWVVGFVMMVCLMCLSIRCALLRLLGLLICFDCVLVVVMFAGLLWLGGFVGFCFGCCLLVRWVLGLVTCWELVFVCLFVIS